MSAEWYLMNEPPIYNGGFEGDEFFSYAQQGFQEMLDTTMLCDNVEFINSDFSLIVPGKAIIQSVTSDTQIKTEDRQILVPIGTLQRFAYVRFDGDIWIIVSEPSNNKFYEKAILKICLNHLRWQDVETKEIFDYWYWCEDITRYSSGTYLGNLIVKFDKQYHLIIPMDNHTRKLHDGMRFILEISDTTPLVFKLTKYDGITGNNKNIKLLNLSLTQTVYDEDRDNADLMIADYYEQKTVAEDLKCRIDYESDEIALSSFGEFSAVFKNESDENVETEFSWKISDNDFDSENLILVYLNNKIKIIVKNNQDLVGKDFTLNVISDKGEIYASIKVKIIALW